MGFAASVISVVLKSVVDGAERDCGDGMISPAEPIFYLL